MKKTVHEKTYHNKIQIKIERVVTKDGEKKVRINELHSTYESGLPKQYFKEKYCCFGEWCFNKNRMIFKNNGLSLETFGKEALSFHQVGEQDKKMEVFKVAEGDLFTEEQMKKIVAYVKKAGTALNRIMKEVRKAEETWTGQETITI